MTLNNIKSYAQKFFNFTQIIFTLFFLKLACIHTRK